MDQARASAEAKLAFEHWEAKRLEDAAREYESALAHADPAHHATPSYYQELAGVRAELGHMEQALSAFREAVRLEETQCGADSTSVANARYFLGEHYLQMKLPAEAMQAIAQSPRPPSQLPLLLLIEALAMAALGGDATATARDAIAAATSDRQREALAARLSHILGATG